QRELAAHILAQREKAEAEGKVIRTPANSSGERSFVSAAAGYFDIFARTHDDLLYGVIAGMQRPGETWAAFDRRLQRFAFTAIVLAPDRYAAWVAGAASRLAGRAIVTNAPFVLAFLGLIAVFLVLTIRNPGAIRSLPGTTDTLLGVTVVALYVAAAAPLA